MQFDPIERGRSYTIASLALTLVGLSGCTSKVVDPGFVPGRWAETMQHYNFHSIFPPQDAMPGDVYLFFAKTNEALSALSPDDRAKEKANAETRYYFRLTRLDVRKLIKRDWQKD
jgi:hypothetical protein